MKYTVLIVVVTLMLSPASAFADKLPVFTTNTNMQLLTLADAQRIALANHPQIKANDFDLKSAAEDIAATRSDYFPQVSGNAVQAFASDSTRIAATNGLNDPTVIDRGSAGIGVSQLITDFGRTNALVNASRSAFEAQKQRAGLSRATVLLNVTRAFYNVLRTQSLLKVAQDTLKTRNIFLKQIASLRNVKMKSDLDLSIARQGVDDANLLLLKAQSNRDDSAAAFSEALGYGDIQNYTLADNYKVTPPDASLNSLLDAALSKNPELTALQADYQTKNNQAIAADRKFYPTISVLGFAGGTPIRTDSQKINATYLTGGVNLSIPIFTGGKLNADAKKAQYQAKAAEMQVEIKKNELIRDIHMAFDNVQTAYKNISVTTQMHRNIRKSLDLTKERYDIGKSSIVDLSQAQLSETEAAVAETDATYDYLIQRTFLEYVVGVLANANQSEILTH